MSDLDAWIRAAVRRELVPTAAKIAELRERMARAPFLSERSLEWHLGKRLEEQQWRTGTSSAEYHADLRLAVSRSREFVVGTRRGGTIILAVGSTRTLLPTEVLGSDPLPHLVVIYSAERDRLITGYQYSGAEKLSLPEGALWLR